MPGQIIAAASKGGWRPIRGRTVGVFSPLQNFSPLSVAGLQCWYDASLLTGADASGIATWADSSGNGNTAVQAGGPSQPILKLAILNGKNVARFDGSAQKMTIAGTMTIKRLFWVSVYGAAGTFADFSSVFSGQASAEGFMGEAATNHWYNSTYDIYRVNGVATNADAPIDSFKVVDAADSLSAFTETGWQISGDRFFGRLWKGDIAEIFGYSSDPSAGDIVKLENYLAAKWGITF